MLERLRGCIASSTIPLHLQEIVVKDPFVVHLHNVSPIADIFVMTALLPCNHAIQR